MSIEFNLNGKNVKAKPNDSFGDVFDNNCQGKFLDKEWVINGQLNPTIVKTTKINNVITQGSVILCQPKGTYQQPPAGFPQYGNQGFAQQQQTTFGQQPQPPFGQQPPPPFGQQPPPPFGQQPPPTFGSQPFGAGKPAASQNMGQQKPSGQAPGGLPGFQFKPSAPIIQQKEVKRQGAFDRSGQEEINKLIKGFKVTINNYGNTVILEKESGEFKATFLEENAKESEQCKIQITPQEIIANPEEQLKLVVGRDSSSSTKVLFLVGYRGVAIRWYTGLQTKFEFWIDE